MKFASQTSKILLISALVVILAFSSLACSISGIPSRSGSATIDIAIEQDEIDMLFSKGNMNDDTHDRLFKEITGIEIHDGYVRVFGVAETSQGDDVTGSYDASLSAVDNALQAQIIAVDIADVNMDDPRIVETNEELARELAEAVRETNGEVLFKEVTLTEGKLQMNIQVNFHQD